MAEFKGEVDLEGEVEIEVNFSGISQGESGEGVATSGTIRRENELVASEAVVPFEGLEGKDGKEPDVTIGDGVEMVKFGFESVESNSKAMAGGAR